MKKIFAILFAVCAISVVLSGCGSKEEAPADGGTTGATAGTTGDAAGK